MIEIVQLQRYVPQLVGEIDSLHGHRDISVARKFVVHLTLDGFEH